MAMRQLKLRTRGGGGISCVIERARGVAAGMWSVCVFGWVWGSPPVARGIVPCEIRHAAGVVLRCSCCYLLFVGMERDAGDCVKEYLLVES